MTQISQLLQYSDAEKRAILKHHNISESEFEDLVEQLKEWSLKTSLPLEHINSTNLKTSLLNGKLSVEKSKKTLEGYFRIRTINSDFFDRLLPNTEEYEKAKVLAKVAVIPKLSPDLCRVTVFRMDDPRGEASDGLLYTLAAFMGIELRIQSDDFFFSNILIIDLQGFDMHNLIKFTPSVTQKLIDIMLAVNLRLKNIHLVNLPSLLEKILLMMKLLLPAKFFEKVRPHADYESLYEYIPKEYLPSNYGGTQPSIEKLHDINTRIMKTVLLNGKLSLEKSKKSLYGYFRVRTINTDFYDRLLPNTEEYEKSKVLAKMAVIPKLSPDLCRVTVFRMDDTRGEASDGLLYVLAAFMGVELRIQSDDYFFSNILIIDLQDFDMHNLIKFTPSVTRTLIDVMLAINLRLKNIHLVNLPSVLEKTLMMMKIVFPAKFFEKIRPHANFESLYEYIPKEYLPSNYGGTQPSIEEIHEKWCQEIEKHEAVFEKLLGAKLQNLEKDAVEQNGQFGMEGSFRKLAVD